MSQTSPTHTHNVFVVSYGIARPNKQTNKSPHRCPGSTLIAFVIILQSHGTQRGCCFCMGKGEGESVCDVPHQIGEKFLGAVYVEALFKQIDVF